MLKLLLEKQSDTLRQNTRVWDGKYWVPSPNACHNERVREVLV